MILLPLVFPVKNKAVKVFINRFLWRQEDQQKMDSVDAKVPQRDLYIFGNDIRIAHHYKRS